MTPAEAIERLLDGADLLHISGVAYLISPVSNDMLDGLAVFGTDTEDDEPEPDFNRHALDRRDAVEQKILATPATSMRGVAVKIRLVTHCTESADLTPFYATPAREIDYEKECIVLECEAKAAISALLDAERLAGV